MSSLWTPSGEHRVERDQPARAEPQADAGDGPSLEDLTPEQRAQVEEMARQMEDARERVLQAPPGTVIGQQALQFYELAALYLSQEPPRLDEAQTAIDALKAVIDSLGDRLGEAETPLRQALHQVQMAYVEVKKGE